MVFWVLGLLAFVMNSEYHNLFLELNQLIRNMFEIEMQFNFSFGLNVLFDSFAMSIFGIFSSTMYAAAK